MNVERLILDALARVVSAEEAIEDGDVGLAFSLLVDLEGDLVGSLAALQEIEVRR